MCLLVDGGKIRKENSLYFKVAAEEEEKTPVIEEIEKGKEVRIMAEIKEEQGPFLDLIDKITDKETTLNVNMEDIGGKVFGRSLRLMGKVNIDLGTLKKSE